jgi:hypothetical protein
LWLLTKLFRCFNTLNHYLFSNIVKMTSSTTHPMSGGGTRGVSESVFPNGKTNKLMFSNNCETGPKEIGLLTNQIYFCRCQSLYHVSESKGCGGCNCLNRTWACELHQLCSPSSSTSIRIVENRANWVTWCHGWEASNQLCRLVAKPGCWEIGFRTFLLKFTFYSICEAHKKCSLLDTIFNYIFYFGPPGAYLYLSPQNPLHVSRLHVVGFLDLFIDVFLEVQNKRYSWILCLLDYIAYGLHLWYKI